MYGRATGNTAALIQAGAIIESLLPWIPGDGSTKCFFDSDKVKVYTKERGYVRLASVKVGEYVLTHKGHFRKVLANEDRQVKDINSVELELLLGKRKTSKISITPDHLFMDNLGNWIQADTITESTKLMRIGEMCNREGCENVINIPPIHYNHTPYCSSSCATIGEHKYDACHEKHRELAKSGQQILQKLHKNPVYKQKYLEISRKYISKIHKSRIGKTYNDLYGAEAAGNIKDKLRLAYSLRSDIAAYFNNRKTKPELAMASLLTNLGYEFKEQKWLLQGKYRVDFFLTKYNTIIEVDGEYWHDRPGCRAKDSERDSILHAELGYDTIRFDAGVVLKTPEIVTDRLVRTFANHRGEYVQAGDVKVLAVRRVVRSGMIRCLLVEEDESFVVTGGLVSHNCLVSCKCRWDLKIIKVDKKSGDKTVRAVWRLSPAEHCETCIDRNGHVVTIVVPKDVNVPKYIGTGV
jgi:very-short-patch-repair endonuclease